jgi:hypothetical protein
MTPTLRAAVALSCCQTAPAGNLWGQWIDDIVVGRDLFSRGIELAVKADGFERQTLNVDVFGDCNTGGDRLIEMKPPDSLPPASPK